MDTLSVDILNPKAKKLLQDLADMELIAIREASKLNFEKTLDRLRSQENPPSLEEITAEVELVRAENYKMGLMKQASTDQLFLADVKEISDDFKAIDGKGI